MTSNVVIRLNSVGGSVIVDGTDISALVTSVEVSGAAFDLPFVRLVLRPEVVDLEAEVAEVSMTRPVIVEDSDR